MSEIEEKIRRLAALRWRVDNMGKVLAEKRARRERNAGTDDAAMLAGIDENIERMEIRLEDKTRRLAELQAELDGEVSRSEVRLAFIDFDARRNPRTDRWCIRCQKDLAPDAKARRIRLVHVDGWPHAMAAEDVRRYENGRLALPPKSEDMGWYLIGPECIRRQGAEWTVDPE